MRMLSKAQNLQLLKMIFLRRAFHFEDVLLFELYLVIDMCSST